MRHEPARVGGVAVEAAPELIHEAAGRHALQGQDRHLERDRVARPPVVAQEQPHRKVGRELGRTRQTAVRGIEALLEGGHRRLDGGAAGRGRPVDRRRRPAERGADGVAQRLRGILDARPVGLPRLGQKPEEREQAATRPAVAVARGPVGAAEEGSAVGVEKDAEGPPAVPGQRLHGRHVHGVHVRPLLPVHLDGHEVRVEDGRDLLVLEGLALHHVTPVAGRVAHGEEDRPARAPRLLEGLVTPGPPGHRVVRVLQKVRARLERQPVGEAWTPGPIEVAGARGPSRSTGLHRRDEPPLELGRKGRGARERGEHHLE